MPIITITYDQKRVHDTQVKYLAQVTRETILGSKHLRDITYAGVYALSPEHQLGTDPVEITIQITRAKIVDQTALIAELSAELATAKVSVELAHGINLYIVPMDWTLTVGI